MKVKVFVNFHKYEFDNLATAEQFAIGAVEGYVPDFNGKDTDFVYVEINYTDIDGFHVNRTKRVDFVKEEKEQDNV